MLGKNLFELRKKYNISQEILARRLDVSRQTIYNWESNSAMPSADKLSKLSEIFNVPIESFFAEEIAVADSKPKVLKTVEEDNADREEPRNDASQGKTLRRKKLKLALLITLLTLCGIGIVCVSVWLAVACSVAFSNTGHDQAVSEVWYITPRDLVIILAILLVILIGIITAVCIIRAVRKKKANVKDVLHDIK